MDAELVTAWTDLCQQLAPAFTAPTPVTFLHVATGWVLCRSRPAVTSLVLTAGGGVAGARGPARGHVRAVLLPGGVVAGRRVPAAARAGRRAAGGRVGGAGRARARRR